MESSVKACMSERWLSYTSSVRRNEPKLQQTVEKIVEGNPKHLTQLIYFMITVINQIYVNSELKESYKISPKMSLVCFLAVSK